MEKTESQELLRRLMEGLPASLQAARADIEAHFGRVLQSGLKRLDLVSREEFDAQARVLLRSRELLATLEARVAQLETNRGNSAK
ncbi:MAG: accessory factor UbiK family protein [Pseudomonadota bacterium]